MIRHTDLGSSSFAQRRTLVALINTNQVAFGGHRPGKIYGRLDCRAGKRMKSVNRVFFRSEAEAISLGYRPCAVCLSAAYKEWNTVQTNQSHN